MVNKVNLEVKYSTAVIGNSFKYRCR